jgi:hypothetical protein
LQFVSKIDPLDKVAVMVKRVHEALIVEHLGDELIGHLSRDGTAIEVRERPARANETTLTTPFPDLIATSQTDAAATTPETQSPDKTSPISRQRQQPLEQMFKEIPIECNRGTKSNAQGYKQSWNGYKLYINTADCGAPISHCCHRHQCTTALQRSHCR